MGTGKTKCLLRSIDEFERVLVISFRRTFASEFAAKSKGFKNYLDIDTVLDMNDTPRIVV